MRQKDHRPDHWQQGNQCVAGFELLHLLPEGPLRAQLTPQWYHVARCQEARLCRCHMVHPVCQPREPLGEAGQRGLHAVVSELAQAQAHGHCCLSGDQGDLPRQVTEAHGWGLPHADKGVGEPRGRHVPGLRRCTMRIRSTPEVLAGSMLKYYRIVE